MGPRLTGKFSILGYLPISWSHHSQSIWLRGVVHYHSKPPGRIDPEGTNPSQILFSLTRYLRKHTLIRERSRAATSASRSELRYVSACSAQTKFACQ